MNDTKLPEDLANGEMLVWDVGSWNICLAYQKIIRQTPKFYITANSKVRKSDGQVQGSHVKAWHITAYEMERRKQRGNCVAKIRENAKTLGNLSLRLSRINLAPLLEIQEKQEELLQLYHQAGTSIE